MAHELGVWLSGTRVGRLMLEDGHLAFQYHPDWLNSPLAFSLSCSLPLQSETFDAERARPFFSGLLPEGQLRLLIARRFQVSNQNDFALLDRLGGECAGAITLLPGEAVPSSDASRREVRWLDDRQLAGILDELPRRPMLAGEDGLRLSLAGAQDKLPVVFNGKQIGLPLDGTPSSHILKPAIAAVEDSVSNEGFCLALAHALGLPAAHTDILERDGRRFLLVERNDRESASSGQIIRLHQEDFCQALGVVPEMKYQNEGGPDLPACFELLRRTTRPSALQILNLLDYAIFNALIGNHDAHAKNFSLLYRSRYPTLAPLYDAQSTAVYPELTPKMAMKLGSRYKFTEVEARHWDQFAERAGLARAQTRKRLGELAKALPTAARELLRAPHFENRPVLERICALIEQRSALTLRRLAEAS